MRVGLYAIPQSDSNLQNYTSLPLRHNHLTRFNFSVLVSLLPQVVLVDLRDNDPVLCEYLIESKPSTLMKIISDCHHPTSDKSVTHPTKPLTPDVFFSTFKSTTTTTLTTTNQHLTTQITKMKSSTATDQDFVYIYVSIAAIFLLPSTLIALRFIIRCWRSYTHRVQQVSL